MLGLPHKSKKKSQLKSISAQWYGLVFFISLSIFFLAFHLLRDDESKTIKQTLIDITVPVMAFFATPTQSAAGITNKTQDFIQVYSDNAKLKQEIQQMRIANAELENLRSENEALRALAKVPVEANNSYISARIISDTDGLFYRSVLVMAGEKHGAQEDMPVISANGLVGRTVEVSHETSRVLLLSDWASRIPVVIEGTDIYATLIGRNISAPQLIHVLYPPSLQENTELNAVKNGMRVVTSGRGGIFPPAMPIGTIQATPEQQKSFETPQDITTINVIPYVQPESLTFIRIILTNPPLNPTLTSPTLP